MKEIIVNVCGNMQKAIEKDGKIYVQPWFDGQILGDVVDTFLTEDGKGYHILLRAHDYYGIGLWITATYKELCRIEIEEPLLGKCLYFCVLQKAHHAQHAKPYRIAEGWPIDD